MITEQRYQQLEKMQEIPMDAWYEYFLERGGTPVGLEQFTPLFSQIIQGFTIQTGTNVRYVTFETALSNFYTYYRKKFKLDE